MWNKRKEALLIDSTYPPFQYYAMRILKTDITLTSEVNIDDTNINVSPGHGFVIGEYIVLWDNNIFEQLEIVNVVDNIITIPYPIASNFSLNTKIIRGSIHLNVDAETTSVDVIFSMYNTIIPINLHKVIINMQHGTLVPDDGKFGGIAALTNGIYIREVNFFKKNFGCYKTNQDFRDKGGIIEYSQKAPAGTYATNIIFNIKEVFGQAVIVNPMYNHYIMAKLRDDFSDLDRFVISLIGTYTEGQ